jgi:SMODS-associated and fused to various effectors sensor domain
MSTDRPQTPRPSGVRMAGDDYQHLYTWLHALHLLRDSEGVTRVEFEVRDAGNVDDLVVHRRDQPTLYHQIKFVIDQRELLTQDWFTTIPQGGRKSPLQRFFESFTDLSRAGPPAELALWTNRQLAPNDPILKHLDSRSDKLGARFFEASAGSATGKARRDWANHLGVSEDEMLAMLEHLRVYPGRGSLEELRRSCGIYMELVGLRGDIEAVSLGTSEIRRLIIDGCSALENEEMNQLVDRLGLRLETPRATLAIQAIDRHPGLELALASVDWIAEFPGAEPRERRQTTDPSAWNTKFKHELSAAVDEIRRKGFIDIRIEGAFRLSTGFAAGAAAPRAAGLTVAFRDWSSNGVSTEFPVAVTEHHVGDGGELAVALCVTSHIEGDVLDYIQANSLPVAKLIEIAPGSGVGQTSIPGEAAALGFVFAAFDEIRRAARSAAKLHLFQSAPNGIGILLGHLWNRVPVTQLYDDANSPEGYFPTFLLAS